MPSQPSPGERAFIHAQVEALTEGFSLRRLRALQRIAKTRCHAVFRNPHYMIALRSKAAKLAIDEANADKA